MAVWASSLGNAQWKVGAVEFARDLRREHAPSGFDEK